MVRVLPEINYAVVQAPPGQLQASRRQLRTWPGVVQVDLDRCALPAYEPNDQLWPDQWHMKAIKADLAWDTTKGDGGVVVAVIDTGVSVDHPDLMGNVWVNTDELPGNNIDDDGNGYVDDVNGYDFAYNDSVPDDVYGHGTPCAGLVAAMQDNVIGISGVAPQCKVMALKASIDEGYFYDSANVAAYLYAANNGAKVLSMSFFSDRVSQAERDAIDYCWNHGVVPVAAAGNSATVYPHYPAAYENVVSVAAVTGSLNKASFSNYGSWVDVSAPGTGLSTITRSGGYTDSFGGTSGACPHVAGVAALCFSANPTATNVEVRAALEDTATLQTQSPFGEFSNYGLVDAEAAVLRMNGGPVTSHPPTVRYVTRLAQAMSRLGSKVPARIYGRGFGPGNTVELIADGLPLNYQAKSRDWIDFNTGAATATLQVRVNGNEVANLSYPSGVGVYHLLTDASTQGATLTGGFLQALKQDTTFIRCTRRSDGSILVQANFRRVNPTQNMVLTLRRQYTGTSGAGTETVQLYDWSSASYPYGSFVTVGSGACPTTMTTSTFNVPNASRFVDFEGTVYMLITTSDDLPTGSELRIDHTRFGS